MARKKPTTPSRTRKARPRAAAFRADEPIPNVNPAAEHATPGESLPLSLSNNDLVNLLSSMQIAIVMLSRDLRIRRFTPLAEKSLKLIHADIGRPIRDVKLAIEIPDLEARIVEAMDTVTVRELELQDRDGRWYSVRIHPYRTLEDAIEGAVVVLVDVDTIKRAEQAIRESEERKNEFIAVLGHELRNPLSAARNASRLLGLSQEPEAMREARDIIDRQTSHMARLIDDLLDLSRINFGKVRLRVEPLDLTVALRSVIQATAPQREVLEHQLECQVPDGPLWVSADPLRLEQVFANLLANASKFTPKRGRIWLTVELESAADERQQVAVHVRDNGIGVDAAALPRIFDLFVQAGGESDLSRGGLGLGLTVARQLVEMHGGSIEARSDGHGKGSEFVVRLPLLSTGAPAAPKSRRGAVALKATSPRRMLVVDDNRDSAESMRLLFSIAGHVVRTVGEGGGAVEAAASLNADAVLLDIGLPDIDGYEVARRLRADPRTRDVLIIAITGYGRDEDTRRSREAGIDHHAVKPIDADTVLARVMEGRKGRETPA